jgi:hypothetical protein
MIHKKRHAILAAVVVLVGGVSVYAISKVFIYAPATQTTIVSSPIVPSRQMGSNTASTPTISSTGVSANQPQLTTDEFDKRLKHNLDGFFSKPSENNSQSKPPDPVKVQ